MIAADRVLPKVWQSRCRAIDVAIKNPGHDQSRSAGRNAARRLLLFLSLGLGARPQLPAAVATPIKKDLSTSASQSQNPPVIPARFYAILAFFCGCVAC